MLQIISRDSRKVLYRSYAAVVHGAAGPLTTPVPLTNLPDAAKTVERCTGISSNANDYYLAALYRDAGNLVIKTVAAVAMTIKVAFEIVEARGKILRLAPVLVSSSVGATGAHTDPNLDDVAWAKVYPTGMYASSAPGYHPCVLHRLDSVSDLYTEISRMNGSYSITCPLVIEYGRAA